MLNESTLDLIFDFLVVTLPRLAIDFITKFFTPLRVLLGDSIYSAIKTFFLDLLPDSLGSFFWDNILNPLFNTGLAGLFGVTTIIVILVLKLIDLLIPV